MKKDGVREDKWDHVIQKVPETVIHLKDHEEK